MAKGDEDVGSIKPTFPQTENRKKQTAEIGVQTDFDEPVASVPPPPPPLPSTSGKTIAAAGGSVGDLGTAIANVKLKSTPKTQNPLPKDLQSELANALKSGKGLRKADAGKGEVQAKGKESPAETELMQAMRRRGIGGPAAGTESKSKLPPVVPPRKPVTRAANISPKAKPPIAAKPVLLNKGKPSSSITDAKITAHNITRGVRGM